MKTLKYISFVFAALLVLTGCEDFLDVNKSIDSPTTITVDQALPTAVFYAAQQVYDHAEYGVYLSQALTTASKSQTGSYAYSQGWEFLSMNRHPQWRRHYYDLGANINEMIKAAEKIDSKNFILIGRTIMLQSTMFTTDVFGDMPRKNAYTATSPTYDTQEEVYEWMFQEADALVALYDDPAWVDNPANVPITQKMDRIFSGDMKKWGLYAKSLRARLWLRKLPNWNNTPEVCQQIIDMVDDILNDSEWEEPRYKFNGGTNEQNCPWGPAAPIINSWESRGNRLATSIPTAFFTQAILGAYPMTHSYNQNRRYAIDPRAEKLMVPRTDNRLLWLESNIGMDVSRKVTDYPDLFCTTTQTNPFTKNDGYVPLITYYELMFIKAEAQYWKGDKTEAFRTTDEVVRKSMMDYGISGNMEGSKNADGSNMTGRNKQRYDAFFEIRLPGEDKFKISDLMQQKYVLMYLQPEQWTDMRRYNYSSETNGIQYDGTFVYTVNSVFNGASNAMPTPENCKQKYSLRRPYNLYVPYWDQADSYGTTASLSPNAWIMRLNPDPETEDKYNRDELERIGAYKNPEWLKKRMIWGYNNSGKATTSEPTEWK